MTTNAVEDNVVKGDEKPATDLIEQKECTIANDLHRKTASDQAGFIDPYTVVRLCLPIMQKSAYKPIRPVRCNRKLQVSPSGMKYCEAIQFYMDPWVAMKDVQEAVNRYIAFPCELDLRASIRDSHSRAVHFLITYLRARGPLMEWEIRPGNDDVMGRIPNSVLADNLKRVNNSEFTSVVVLGRYMQYLVGIAYAHELYFFRTILSKVWGPLFLRPYYSPLYKTTIPSSHERQRVQLAIAIFAKLIEAANWLLFEPIQNAQKLLYYEPDDVGRFPERVPPKHDPENTYLRMPKSLTGTMSDQMRDDAVEFALQQSTHCPVHYPDSRLIRNVLVKPSTARNEGRDRCFM